MKKVNELPLRTKINIFQAFTEIEAIDLIHAKKRNIDLVLLKSDFDEKVVENIFDSIYHNRCIKTILLSSVDDGDQREYYFSKGILDYYIISEKIENIVNDILDTLIALEKNKKEIVPLESIFIWVFHQENYITEYEIK